MATLLSKIADVLDEVPGRQSELAMDQLKKIMLVAAGGGAAFRGMSGLMGMLQRNAQTEAPSAMSANIVPLKLPKREEEKLATVGPYKDVWWSMPAHFAAGLGGAYGGYKLMDYILDKRRQHGLQSEVDTAKQKFEKALTTPEKQEPNLKVGEDGTMSRQLDEIYAVVEKQAAPNMNEIMGMLATLAIPLTVGSGAIGYNLAKGHRQSEVLDEAAKERQRKLQTSMPPLVVGTHDKMAGFGSFLGKGLGMAGRGLGAMGRGMSSLGARMAPAAGAAEQAMGRIAPRASNLGFVNKLAPPPMAPPRVPLPAGQVGLFPPIQQDMRDISHLMGRNPAATGGGYSGSAPAFNAVSGPPAAASAFRSMPQPPPPPINKLTGMQGGASIPQPPPPPVSFQSLLEQPSSWDWHGFHPLGYQNAERAKRTTLPGWAAANMGQPPQPNFGY